MVRFTERIMAKKKIHLDRFPAGHRFGGAETACGRVQYTGTKETILQITWQETLADCLNCLETMV